MEVFSFYRKQGTIFVNMQEHVNVNLFMKRWKML